MGNPRSRVRQRGVPCSLRAKPAAPSVEKPRMGDCWASRSGLFNLPRLDTLNVVHLLSQHHMSYDRAWSCLLQRSV
jgi:hypothetical protein